MCLAQGPQRSDTGDARASFFLEQLVSLFDFDSLHPINNLSVI